MKNLKLILRVGDEPVFCRAFVPSSFKKIVDKVIVSQKPVTSLLVRDDYDMFIVESVETNDIEEKHVTSVHQDTFVANLLGVVADLENTTEEAREILSLALDIDYLSDNVEVELVDSESDSFYLSFDDFFYAIVDTHDSIDEDDELPSAKEALDSGVSFSLHTD